MPGQRRRIGRGGFGAVYETVDANSGDPFAVKVVDMGRIDGGDPLARAALHREIKIMERLSHPHVIECLGSKDFDTDQPLTFMPLCEGTLHDLFFNGGKASFQVCEQVLPQMLRALDYLAAHRVRYRGIEPLNILCRTVVKYESDDSSEYHFQLAVREVGEEYGVGRWTLHVSGT
ncbi:serine/threonine-protein kinase-like protein [Hapsidospora chrysogenum ATCC 11550]|uniref:non-specific serine/threonine protein kinase n=1 Tax=Hapsidospora chrysogenum (strain ATCC 11550 / CBS 779.69 / DSM 880 / IAM 14645 / JCM 23072 / IMI 49137) TaxID=857340 RepID=A0A086SXQ3_HAPC1|nr:serine/threonine-protein kinase-like protein [Hapsidospora chrysogenum ATCC 11550]